MDGITLSKRDLQIAGATALGLLLLLLLAGRA